MNKSFGLIGAAGLSLALLLISPAPLTAADTATPNDTARYLAGLAPGQGSPLAALTKDAAWRGHARHLDKAWARLQKQQLSHIRAWSKEHLPEHRKLMLYMFSGPDFLYADAFYPNAETYVLSALEPVGPIPNVTRLSRGRRAAALHNLRASMQTVLSYSFFITKQMKVDLRSGNLTGTLPVLYVFLARSGNTLNEVQHVSLNPDGTVTPRGAKRPKGSSPGVKIGFTGSQGRKRTLYYFATDLSNGGLKKSGFLKFTETFGPADSLIKSASYLLHYGHFSTARKTLLERSAVLIQDDSGVPIKYFPAKGWQLSPFGKYLGPIELFPNRYQPRMQKLFSRGRAKPIKFGIGYRWRRNQSNVLLAIKQPTQASQ